MRVSNKLVVGNLVGHVLLGKLAKVVAPFGKGDLGDIMEQPIQGMGGGLFYLELLLSSSGCGLCMFLNSEYLSRMTATSSPIGAKIPKMAL
jgi:hypothetical protein